MDSGSAVSSRLARSAVLGSEARSIHAELRRSGYRDRFDFVTRWAAEPLDLLRELRELKPAVVLQRPWRREPGRRTRDEVQPQRRRRVRPVL